MSPLDQSIADMNRSVIQLVTTQQTSSAKLQAQAKHYQAVQMAHTDALQTLTQSTQLINLTIFL